MSAVNLIFWAKRERLKEVSDRFSDYYLDIAAHSNIIRHLNITRYVLKIFKLSKRDKGLKR